MEDGEAGAAQNAEVEEEKKSHDDWAEGVEDAMFKVQGGDDPENDADDEAEESKNAIHEKEVKSNAEIEATIGKKKARRQPRAEEEKEERLQAPKLGQKGRRNKETKTAKWRNVSKQSKTFVAVNNLLWFNLLFVFRLIKLWSKFLFLLIFLSIYLLNLSIINYFT